MWAKTVETSVLGGQSWGWQRLPPPLLGMGQCTAANSSTPGWWVTYSHSCSTQNYGKFKQEDLQPGLSLNFTRFVTLAMLFTSLSFINNNSTQHTECHKILHLWDCPISGLIRDLNLDPFRGAGLDLNERGREGLIFRPLAGRMLAVEVSETGVLNFYVKPANFQKKTFKKCFYTFKTEKNTNQQPQTAQRAASVL